MDIAVTIWRGASAPLVLRSVNEDQLVTELVGNAMLSGFRSGKRLCLN
jgi:hypothetical protein